MTYAGDAPLDRVRLTRRLRLEPVGSAHLDDVVRLHADPAVAEWMGGQRDRDWLAARIAAAAQAWRTGIDYWTAYERVTGRFVGRGGLAVIELDGEPVTELAWALMPEAWGQGYATELGGAAADVAFGELGRTDVVAFTMTTNSRSRAVMTRLGMTYVRDFVRAELPHALYTLSQTTWAARRSAS